MVSNIWVVIKKDMRGKYPESSKNKFMVIKGMWKEEIQIIV